MRFGYRPSRLLGAVHSGGNVVFSPDGNTLYSPVTNRVVVFDLIRHVSTMLPYEHAYPIRRVAVSPNGRFLLTVDTGGYLFLGHVSRGIILCRMRLKRPNKVRDLVFSPDGQFFAVTQDRQFQVWRTPGAAREFAPFVLHRTFGSHGDEILSLAWAPCGQYLLTGSKDLTVRIWSLHPLPPAVFTPATLSGHRDRIVGAFFSASGPVEARDPPLLSDGGAGSPPSLPPSLPPPSTPKGPDTVWTSPRSSPLSSLRIYSIARDGFLYAWVIDPSTQTWKCHDRHAFQKSRRAHVVSVCYHAISSPLPAAAATAPSPGTALLVVGFSDGVFGLYDLPTGAVVHTLSVSSGQIGTVALNLTGEWLALGCAPLGQLLVWEWQSETYVLKQQGHAQAVNAVAYSPDGQVMATGGEDAKVKLWSTASGFSFVTFTAHDAPVTALAFLGSGQAVLSASLDGTVRAHDLLRYRNFRTLTTPAPTQLLSLAVDPSGEVVCAGSSEPFEVGRGRRREGGWEG
ncbi:small nucleolar ribonucleoprotein complex subunit, partial [Nannochloropsis gaditana]